MKSPFGTASLVLLTAAAFAMSGVACKLQLTPESLSKAYTGIKNAKKDLTPENEYFVGRSVATNLLARHDYKYLDSETLLAGELAGLTAYVNNVGQVVALAALSTPREGDRPAPIAGWHFIVVEDTAINGFAAPGGWIFVTRAAVLAAKNEDQLAALLAHEVAHVIRGHALGSIKKSRWAGVTKELLDSSVELDEAALGDLTKVFDGAMDDMIDATLVKGYSRDTEFEADRVAIEILVAAGYNPKALPNYIGTLDKHQDTGAGGFQATHPTAATRIEKLKQLVSKQPAIATAKVRTARFRDATAMLREAAE